MFNYTVAAHPTKFRGITFRSRLEATWAAFFEDVFEWKYEPIDFISWTPDFWLSCGCFHSKCKESREFYAEVKPFLSIDEFKGHPAYKLSEKLNCGLGVDGVMLLGIDPSVVQVAFSCRSGGGIHNNLEFYVEPEYINMFWKRANGITRWKGTK